jgi:hypothetical protein
MKAADDFTTLCIRFPTPWPPAIKRAAAKQAIRLAVLDRLEEDGVALPGDEGGSQ